MECQDASTISLVEQKEDSFPIKTGERVVFSTNGTGTITPKNEF